MKPSQAIPLPRQTQSVYYWNIPVEEALTYGDYFWRARVIDAAGNESAWSETRKLTISFQKKPADETYLTDSTPTLSWLNVSGAQGYALEISIDPGFGDFLIQAVDIPAGTTSYQVLKPTL